MWIKTGDVFGYWTVLCARPGKSFCRCVCGLEKLVSNRWLAKVGEDGGCRPCANRKRSGELRKSVRKFSSELPPKLYRKLSKAVKMAVRRCTNQDHPQWKDWGGRGIQVCREWIDDPSLFVAHLATLPGCTDEDLYLDRINNDGHYEPGNLRFVTAKQSVHNRRCSIRSA